MALTVGQLKRILAERNIPDDTEIVLDTWVDDYNFYSRPTKLKIASDAGKVKKNKFIYTKRGRGARTVIVLGNS